MSNENYVTVGHIASVFDVTERTVQSWHKEIPGIEKDGRGRYHLLSVIRAVYKWQREQAAGRSLDLTAERARLSAEQADRVALKNQVSRKEFVPRSVIVETMATVSRQIAGILEAIPVKLKRETKLKPDQIKIVEREIIKARNVAADVRPEWGQPDGT